MRSYKFKILPLILAVMGLLPLQSACSGTTTSSPAAAPAPPIDLPAPAVLKFVNFEGLNVDLGTISTPASADISKTVYTKGDKVLQYITVGPEFFDLFEGFFRFALSGIAPMEIPASQATTTFQGTVYYPHVAEDLSDPTTLISQHLSGTYTGKLDFAPFDFDNDGTKEACSGNTAVTPICVRFWLATDATAKPFIAGIFDNPPVYLDACNGSYCPAVQSPAVENVCSCSQSVIDAAAALNIQLAQCDDSYCTAYPGTTCTCDQNLLSKPLLIGDGRFKMRFQFWNPDIPSDMGIEIGYIYHQKTLDSIEVRYQVTEYKGLVPNDATGFYIDSVTSRTGPNATGLKSINLSMNMPSRAGSTKDWYQYTQYVGQFVEGEPYWAGHIVFGPEIVELPYDCASMPDGILLEDRNVCANVGSYGSILTDGIAFLDFLDLSDFLAPGSLAFPTDFPAAPTF